MALEEDPAFLHDQIITYIGNKRALLPLIRSGISFVQAQTGKSRLDCLDLFSGSGIVARSLKKDARHIAANDLEDYARVISECYLADSAALDCTVLREEYEMLLSETAERMQNGSTENAGFIEQMYAPRDEDAVSDGERCFYTPRNARYIDIVRQLIAERIPADHQCFFIAPLLSEASIHANTSGVFKGFYKNSSTGRGQFGGNGKNALSRIRGECALPFPVFSRFSCPVAVFQRDAAMIVEDEQLYKGTADGIFDLAYLDPPYNQHPYGSNYFMLNLIASYRAPDVQNVSCVSGIPRGWNRSLFNKRRVAAPLCAEIAEKLRARYLLVSFNSEGFIGREEMVDLLSRVGKVTVLESPYNTFRGSRNLKNRNIHVSEYLFIVEKMQIN